MIVEDKRSIHDALCVVKTFDQMQQNRLWWRDQAEIVASLAVHSHADSTTQ